MSRRTCPPTEEKESLGSLGGDIEDPGDSIHFKVEGDQLAATGPLDYEAALNSAVTLSSQDFLL